MSYCAFCQTLPPDHPDRAYHDHEHGVCPADDNALFERLMLEINQTGLSWSLILRKRARLRAAYAGFDVARVAAFDDEDICRLLNDSGVIRHRLKIQAAVTNARAIVHIQQTHGSFGQWLDECRLLAPEQGVKRLRQPFRFVGATVAGEFLRGCGYWAGAHAADCPVAAQRVQAA